MSTPAADQTPVAKLSSSEQLVESLKPGDLLQVAQSPQIGVAVNESDWVTKIIDRIDDQKVYWHDEGEPTKGLTNSSQTRSCFSYE